MCILIADDNQFIRQGTARLPGSVILTAFLLVTTGLTSLTGFLFPFTSATPAIKLGIISLGPNAFPSSDQIHQAALDLHCDVLNALCAQGQTDKAM